MRILANTIISFLFTTVVSAVTGYLYIEVETGETTQIGKHKFPNAKWHQFALTSTTSSMDDEGIRFQVDFAVFADYEPYRKLRPKRVLFLVVDDDNVWEYTMEGVGKRKLSTFFRETPKNLGNWQALPTPYESGFSEEPPNKNIGDIQGLYGWEKVKYFSAWRKPASIQNRAESNDPRNLVSRAIDFIA